MTNIKRKGTSTGSGDVIVLSFDWAEGYLELPHAKDMPVGVQARLASLDPSTADLSDLLSIIIDGVGPAEAEFLESLTVEEFADVIEAWAERGVAINELDNQAGEGEDEGAPHLCAVHEARDYLDELLSLGLFGGDELARIEAARELFDDNVLADPESIELLEPIAEAVLDTENPVYSEAGFRRLALTVVEQLGVLIARALD